MTIVLRGGSIVESRPPGDTSKKEDKITRLDLKIENGVISEMGDSIKCGDGDTEIDISGKLCLAGFIDLHTHLRDLNQSSKEDIASGSRAAAAGGFTTVLTMANTDPPLDSPMIVENILNRIRDRAVIRVLPIACVTIGMQGERLTEMAQLSEMGVAAFSDDGLPVTNLAVLRRALEYSAITGKPIISHPEDRDLSAGGCINESIVSTRLGLPGIPSMSESACIARELEIVRGTGCHLHFAHVSTAASVDLIAQAKADDQPVTAEASPHHFSLCDEDITEHDTNFKMNPPLRSGRDRAAVIEALTDGTIDAIATDHAPHTAEEKAQPFDTAPFGVIGLETAFSLAHEKLVEKGGLTIAQLSHLMTTAPAAIVKLPDPAIRPGASADLTIVDLDREWIYSTSEGCSKSSNSPFDGRRMRGKVIATIYNGAPVYQDELVKTRI